jgi:hypothetical protein
MRGGAILPDREIPDPSGEAALSRVEVPRCPVGDEPEAVRTFRLAGAYDDTMR